MLKEYISVAYVSLESATPPLRVWNLFPSGTIHLAHNLSDSGSAMGIIEKLWGVRGAVGGQAGGQWELSWKLGLGYRVRVLGLGY